MNEVEPNIGKSYTAADKLIKWALWGYEGTGKTHFAIQTCLLRPNKQVVIFNLEPKSNLMSVLERFPSVLERTTVLPTDEDIDNITRDAYELDPNQSVSAFDVTLSKFVIEKVIDFTFKDEYREVMKNTFFVFDTASQVYQKLMWDIHERREYDEKIYKMAQLAYGDPKRRFVTMVRHAAMWDTDVIWLGRAKQGGEQAPDPKSGKMRWTAIPGKEEPEWKHLLKYDTTTIIHLTKKTEHVLDEQRSMVLDQFGRPKMEEVRYGMFTKHKSGRSDVPIIRNPTPLKVISWLRGKNPSVMVEREES